LLGIETSQIEPLLYNPSRGFINYFGTAITPSFIDYYRRVSPTFLKKNGYQKAIWALRSFSFDPQNRQLLLERCKSCGQLLNFKKTFGVSYCSSCGEDLREVELGQVEIKDEGALEFVVSLIDPQKSLVELDKVCDDLKQFSRGELYTLIVNLAILLEK